ncbi:MAG TPA: hypothetical protein HA263_03015 [Methanoregulaceae archaeon]|nr:hypothetical protein [Methanoregulaceae archaeon]
MKATVYFIDDKVHAAYRKIAESRRSEDRELVAMLGRAFDAIERNAFAGTQIPKRLIPREYHQRYDPIAALWKVDMAGGWRLIYMVAGDVDGTVQVGIIEWFDHGEYERRFGY